MCDKTVDNFPSVFDSVPDRYKTQKMCVKVVSNKPFMLKYCVDRYKAQKMCDKAVDTLILIDLHNISLDDDNFDGDDPESIIHVRVIFFLFYGIAHFLWA